MLEVKSVEREARFAVLGYDRDRFDREDIERYKHHLKCRDIKHKYVLPHHTQECGSSVAENTALSGLYGIATVAKQHKQQLEFYQQYHILYPPVFTPQYSHDARHV